MYDKKITTEDGKIKKSPATTQAATSTEASQTEQTTSTATSEAQPSEDTTSAPATAVKITDTAHKDNPGPVAAQQQSATNDLGGYLANGYYLGAGKDQYTDPALVDQAEEIGKALAAGGVTRAAFNRILRTLKDAEKLSFPAQQGALKKLLPQVTDLENHRKAPPLLRKVVERNRAAVKTPEDYAACLDHFKDIGIYLVAQAAAAGTPKK